MVALAGTTLARGEQSTEIPAVALARVLHSDGIDPDGLPRELGGIRSESFYWRRDGRGHSMAEGVSCDELVGRTETRAASRRQGRRAAIDGFSSGQVRPRTTLEHLPCRTFGR